MNFNEAMQMLGTKLQGKYGHLGFKYKKSDKTLTRHSKNFTYMIAFSSFGGNTKDMELMPMAQAPALGEVVSNTSAKERQHKCEVLISEAMGIASVQNPFTDRNMPYEQPFQPDAGDAEAVPIFVILSPIC